MIKKLFLALSIIFGILTILGAGYVIINHGQVSAGYACVPMGLTLVSFVGYRSQK